jgi:hypothetical protein
VVRSYRAAAGASAPGGQPVSMIWVPGPRYARLLHPDHEMCVADGSERGLDRVRKRVGDRNDADVIVAFIALFVVTPAVWSRYPDRRASAIEVLRMILTAFGRRPL